MRRMASDCIVTSTREEYSKRRLLFLLRSKSGVLYSENMIYFAYSCIENCMI